MLIIKIGGSIQKDSKDYELIAEKIEKYAEKEDKVIVVTSAIKGVTNDLITATENRELATEIVTNIYDRHLKILSKLAEGQEFENGFKQISKLVDELYKIAWSIRVLDEITPRVKDYVLSFGERMASILLAQILKSRKLDASEYPDALLITDENFGEANIIEESSKIQLNQILNKKEKIIVVPGFIGKSTTEKYTTLGRGGSDFTATLLGKLLNVNQVRLITEVPGIMTADPRKFNNAKTIKRLSLEEAIELSQMGAKRLHPRTFEPMLNNNNMTVIIEGLYDEGETVVNGACEKCDVLKGIAVLDDLKMITVESTNIVGKIGSAARVMSVAKNLNINIISISQPASETTISLVINSEDAEIFANKLREIKDIDNVEVQDINAVSVVGCGLQNREIFKEIENVAMQYEIFSISRGLKNVSSTFIVKKDEGYNLAKDLHEVVLKWIN
ncbi:aspartate kinase [Acidianus sulfidivorans JP7]|uniref:Aspartokinase n=1 Tax=Acidianus sulfidivorans JP7 TaxID=619593 RepID=A0A2U9IP68_9CREN|nr:aspartate kinase [Acidianus sulfidivorans]AWR97774.1 aspartate kinase [Acidianus sulfidivorans JP7]